MLASEQKIHDKLSYVRLPTMPQMLAKLMEQCQNEKAGLPELANLVSQDAGMAAKVMRVAHSPAYRRGGQKIGLEQSMMSLGLDMLRTLVISESIFQTFSGFSDSAKIDLRPFWKHSLTAAIIARQAARRIKYPNVDEAYLAGLLHDIGRLALLSAAPKEYAFHFHAPGDDKLCSAEQRTLQMTHAEAGAWVVEQWRLDSFVGDSVLYHHESVDRIADAHPLIRIVWLAHALASRNPQDVELESAALNCGINKGDLSAIMHGVDDLVEQAAKFLSIDLSGLDQPTPAVTVHSVPDRLGDEIHQFVQASELGRFFSSFQDEERLLKAICGAACSEFQFDNICLLLRDDDRNALFVYPLGEGQQRLAGFSISLGKSGPITDAALQNWLNILSPDDAANGIAEEQLLRILGTERLVCLPLTINAHCVGVLIAGTSAARIAGIRSNERALKTFRTQAASALNGLRARHHADQERSAHMREQFRDASRKVAHEVNNPLTIIKNYLRVLDVKLARQEPVSNEMSILDEELNRIGQIINNFADQPNLPADETADVNRCIRNVALLMRDSGFAPLVRIAARTHDNAYMAACSPGKLKQILVNLVKNAIEAMPQGGEISLSIDGTTIQQGRTCIGISVSDTGPGIPPAILEQIFTPVQSTKGAGHRGLGLNIVHDLVSEIGGSITCHSGLGGTTFKLLLPAGSQAEQQHNGRVNSFQKS